MPDQLAAAAAAGYMTASDPQQIHVDPAAARMLLRDPHAVAMSAAGGVLSILLDTIPTPGRINEIEQATGLGVAVTITTPALLEQVRSAVVHRAPGQPDLVLAGVLREAHERGASDVLLTTGQRPAMRVHGRYEQLMNFPLLAADDVQSARSWFASDTPLPVIVTAGPARWRVTGATACGGPTLAVRRLPSAPVRASDLGVPAALLEASKSPHGLIVIASPHGSGKTTTAAAVVDAINTTAPVHVLCIGAPVEYLHRSHVAVVTTQHIGTDVPDAASGVRAARRLAADVIVLDVQGADDVRAALEAASAGHLVVITVASSSVLNAMRQMVTLLPPVERDWALDQLASTLRVAVAQQLQTALNGSPVAVFEVLTATEQVRSALRTGSMTHLAAALEDQPGDGMCSMDRALALNVGAGRLHREAARLAATNQVLFDEHLLRTSSRAPTRELPTSEASRPRVSGREARRDPVTAPAKLPTQDAAPRLPAPAPASRQPAPRSREVPDDAPDVRVVPTRAMLRSRPPAS